MMVLKKRKNTAAVKSKADSFLKSTFMGAAMGVVLWLLLLVAVSYLLSGFDEPENFETAAAFLLVAVCSFASGFITLKLYGVRNILPGIMSGGILLLLVWALSLALSQSNGIGTVPLKLILVFNFIFFAFLGALSGRPSTRAKRRTGR